MKRFASGLETSGKHCATMFYVLGGEGDHLFWVSYIYQKLKSMEPHCFLYQSGF